MAKSTEANSTLTDDTSGRLQRLSPEKRALLMAQLREKRQAEAGQPAIQRRRDPGSYPMSFAQERMWTLSQLEPDSPYYNISVALRLTGPLEVSLLQRALNEVVRRHEVLRAVFVLRQGALQQVIAEDVSIELAVEDLGHLVGQTTAEGLAAELPVELLDRATAESRRVFDLSRAPLLRGQVWRLTDRDHLALLTMHHIVADGWSMGVLVREVALLYESYLARRPYPLPALSLQYADYAAWQRGWLNGDGGDGAKSPHEQQLDYWRRQLAGIPMLLELPTDRPRPVVRTSQGDVVQFGVPREVAEGLRGLARGEGTTLFATLLAAYQVLLHRYSGQDDICTGTPVANRGRAEIESLMGFFVNTVVIRSNLADQPAFRQLVHRVQETILEAQANQDLPFELLVDALQPRRSLSTTPLFQVMFDLNNRVSRGFKLPGLNLSPLETHSRTAKVDLTLFMAETEEGLRGSFEYSTDLWDEPSARRMAGHFLNLLAAAVADPGRPVADLALLQAAEERQMLVGWNDTETEYPRERALQGLFEDQARRSPEAVAVVYPGRGGAPGDEDQQLTYRELNERANRLAHWLREQGVGPDVLVGILMERSLDMMVAILGIVKAGGAYLPMDGDYPPERLAFMVEDGRVPVLLTQQSLVASLPSHGARVLCLDTDWPTIAQLSAENPPELATGDNLAYVIYTSGSTGRPKGVSIPQRAVARLVLNSNYVKFTAEEVIAQASNASFDAATMEIWGAWLNGGRLVGIPRDVVLSPRAFAAELQRRQISVLFVTTALFNMMASEIPGAFGGLKHLLFGGEAVDPRAVRRVIQQEPRPRLLHLYGPTESTTYASWYVVEQVSEEARTVPIGRALSNTRLYVLDRRFRPVPVGVPGQLCIGGDGLARGYLNRPGLTAGKFLPDPYDPRPGARMYLTGDLVRYGLQGDIEFVGRIDHQVKIRGFRVEPGEIEDVLAQHPAVSEAMVVAQEPGREQGGGTFERRLVAYVVPGPGETVDGTELRTFVKQRLPEFMVPAAFVALPAFPLTPNGKIDRQALPWPGEMRGGDEAYVAPRTALEQFLVSQWQAVLGDQRIGIYDNFFEIGGNSLQAAVLINRLQERIGETAHVRAIFMAPTVADLAMYLTEYYPHAVAEIAGERATPAVVPGGTVAGNGGRPSMTARVDATKLALLRRIIQPLPPRPEAEASPKNPPALFVLSPPRSGSTLLRVMLAGNPRLFAPPELDLMSFNTLLERRAAFSGKYSFWLEGPIRAIMEIRGCNADEAQAIVASYEEQGLSTKAFYGQLQAAVGDRLLVDKTPVYALDPAILQRMEQDFADARYIHLVRNPYATVHSFAEAKLDQLFFRYEHPFTLRELGELIWIASHQNILSFLESIPAERRHKVEFEALVQDPQQVMQGICTFLGIDFDPAMLNPYEGDRMTTGIRPDHQMVGDFKFYLRNRIDVRAAERWKRFVATGFLSDMALDLAERLGYGDVSSEPLGGAGPVQGQRLPPLTPVPREGALLLSFAQQRLWFLDQMEPGSAFYNVPAAVRLEGDVDVSVLERTMNEIVRRHEVLRTTFSTVDGKAVPEIAPELRLQIPVHDLRQLPEEAREAEARRLISQEAQQPFDLSTGPLVRARLLRLRDDETIAQVTMHHIVADGWSVGVLIRELGALVEAFARGRPSPLAELPVQYADYAAWQRRLLGEMPEQPETDGLLEAQLAYWRNQLAGSPSLLQLPIDRPRPAVQSQQGRRYLFTLSPTLSRAVRALSREEGTTLFTTLLATFQTLLSRYAGQDDVPVGTPVANRTRAEIEGLIGFFVNTLVMRTDLSGEPSFRELLHRVEAVAIVAYEHQDVPFEMLVDELQPERDMSHTPFFQAMFSLQEAAMQALRLPGLSLQPLEVDSRTAKFDLTLSIVDRPEALAGALEYNTDLFDDSTIQRMAGHFQTLLEAIVADPDQPITSLPILGQAERRQVLSDWARGPEVAAPVDTIHARFAQQAAATPDAIALVAAAAGAEEPETLTFADLDARANQLAHALRQLGVSPDAVVGLLTPRSAAAITGILAVLKAGAAYLPLDPAYPPDRLAFMLHDSGAQIVLTEEPLLHLLPEGFQRYGQAEAAVALCLDADREALAQLPTLAPPQLALPDTLAYVIYTSGSTGMPKGVMVSHRSALNLATALHHAAYAGLHRPLRLSLNAPLSFDASVQQWIMLTHGHSLVIIPQEVRTDAGAFVAFIRHHRLDQLDCVPSQLKLLLDAGLLHPDHWHPAIVFPGGEPIDHPTWDALSQAPHTRFFNMYGPTECTVDSTSALVQPGHTDTADPIASPIPTIGRPLANAQVFVLDRHLQPVPAGVPGELCIAGPGLARGYLHRPHLTAERFLPNPFGPPGSRLYRTGDLVRWLPNGHLQFLGRTDFQVKIRGFRIELGEIEQALRSHPDLRDAVVLARQDGASHQRLVAYTIPADPALPPPLPDLRRFLLQRLPDYMVPAAFVILDAFPLTPNAKIDRRALPAPDEARPDLEIEFTAPRSDQEAILAAIWGAVLGKDRVGIHDNFFELGGDSILSIQVVARANQAGLRLTPKQLFQAPTVAQLAALAGTVDIAQAEQGAVTGPVPLTPIQRQFFELNLAEPSHWNQSILVCVEERLQPAALQAAVGALLTHHDALRLQFTATEAGWQQANAGLHEEVPLEVVDLAGLREDEQALAIESRAAEAQQSLDIGRGRLLRVIYFDLGQDQAGRLLMVVHHLAIDRVSWPILLDDLTAAYEQLAEGQAVQLPSKSTAFRDWARRLEDLAQAPALKAEIGYWTQVGAGGPPVLPVDQIGGLNTEATARTHHLWLDPQATEALVREIHQTYGTTVDDILLTALVMACERWTGWPELLVAMEGHGREDDLLAAAGTGAPAMDVTRTVGWFTTLYPVHLAIRPEAAPGEAIKAVKDRLHRVPRHGMGFGLLRYLCHDEVVRQQMAAVPQPQVSYNYLGQFNQELTEREAFGPAPEMAGPERSPADGRAYLLDITASITDSQLHVTWTYSDQIHRAETIRHLAGDFYEALLALIEHCRSVEEYSYSLSDFPDVDLSDRELDALMAEIGEDDG